MRWTLPETQTMPELRCIYLNGDCEEYMTFISTRKITVSIRSVLPMMSITV
jgi:hypothetical protein